MTAGLACLWTVRVIPTCSIDFLAGHSARDVTHLLADVVVPSAGCESLELRAQINHRLSLEPRSAGFAVDFAVAGPAGRDAAQWGPARDDVRCLAGGSVGGQNARQVGVIRGEIAHICV